jgi:hypothetical protein
MTAAVPELHATEQPRQATGCRRSFSREGQPSLASFVPQWQMDPTAVGAAIHLMVSVPCIPAARCASTEQ